MTLRSWFNHAVVGFVVVGGQFPRSQYEAGFGSSVALLGAVLINEIHWLKLACVGLAIVWMGFYLAAFGVALKLQDERGDREYDRRGKYKLSKEYWSYESAAAGRKRRKSKADR